MKKFFTLMLIFTLAMTTFLVGCGADKEETKKPDQQAQPDQATEKQLKVAMVTDVGGVNDQSFNQSAWEGLQRAEQELGIKASYKESKQDADYAPNMEQLLDEENDLIWGIGFKMGDTILAEAQKNPDQKYAIIDYAYDQTPENLVGVVFKAEQASFLVGYIAGKMTKTGKVGFVGGIEGVVIDGFDYGFQAGVKYANPNITVLRQYAESFTDSAKGKAIANSMYQDGADIVFHAAGGVGDGVIEAAKEQGKFAIGVDRDQNNLAPDNVITSAMKRVDNGIYNIVKQLKEGNFPGGQTVVLGLAEGAVDIAPSSDKHVPKEILDEVNGLKEKIINGEIEVPYNKETFDKFEVK
ncbi:MAG: BMP family protein [Tepidibacillus sp.]